LIRLNTYEPSLRQILKKQAFIYVRARELRRLPLKLPQPALGEGKVSVLKRSPKLPPLALHWEVINAARRAAVEIWDVRDLS